MPQHTCTNSAPSASAAISGFERSGYTVTGAFQGDRIYQIICQEYIGIVASGCTWSDTLSGGHQFFATVGAGEVLTGLKSFHGNEKRSFQYRKCTLSCDSTLAYQPANETACAGAWMAIIASVMSNAYMDASLKTWRASPFAPQCANRELTGRPTTEKTAVVRGVILMLELAANIFLTPLVLMFHLPLANSMSQGIQVPHDQGTNASDLPDQHG